MVSLFRAACDAGSFQNTPGITQGMCQCEWNHQTRCSATGNCVLEIEVGGDDKSRDAHTLHAPFHADALSLPNFSSRNLTVNKTAIHALVGPAQVRIRSSVISIAMANVFSLTKLFGLVGFYATSASELSKSRHKRDAAHS